jgi:hypothetical protein
MEESSKMTTAELESVSETLNPLDLPRHDIEAPELSLCETFYPFGFPTELRTNSPEILLRAHDLWSIFGKQYDTKPVRVDVHLVEVEDGSTECPPAPVPRMAMPHLFNMADANNYCVADMDRLTTQLVISRETLKYRSYLDYFFLGCAPLIHITCRYTTAVHAGCVARNGRGVLLCGNSGAGKSTLSYACARAGWTYVTDDGSLLLNEGEGRTVTGNCHQLRFRTSAVNLFPELEGLEVTPRAAGKPSIELPTAPMTGITCASTAHVDFLVFLNRSSSGPQELVPYRKDKARLYLTQTLLGPLESLTMQCAALERLLKAEIFELNYSDMAWAVRRLEALTVEGR